MVLFMVLFLILFLVFVGVLHNVLPEHGGPCIFPPMSTLTLDTIVTLSGKIVLDNVLHEHSGLPCVLPFAVQLDLGHPPDTQGYLGLLSEPFNTTQNF